MDPLFAVHRLNSHGLARADAMADAFDTLLAALKMHCPDCREFSIAKTKLEEAAFYAKKAMAMDLSNQEK